MKTIVNKGERYGRLVIIKEKNKYRRHRKFQCICDCGNIKIIRLNSLRNGTTKSCGCLQKEKAKKHLTIHGNCYNKTYNAWLGMKGRCNNKTHKSYKYYGGRGITYSKEWEKFENFDKDMGGTFLKGLELDRIDNNGNYCKENCRWVTRKINAGNRRDNVIFKYKGETKCMKVWCDDLNMKYNTVMSRIYRGKSIKESLKLI